MYTRLVLVSLSSAIAISGQTFAPRQLPVVFEPNLGQSHAQAQFLARNGGFTLFLYNREVVFSRTSASRSVHLKLKGANSEVQLQGEEPLPGVSNYFLGTDPKAWRIGIRQYAQIRYRNVYPGIDLLFRGNNGKLEFDFAVAPGADPKVISLAIRGAKPVTPSTNGDLLLQADGAQIVLREPAIYQEVAGRRTTIGGGYRLDRHQLRFHLLAYDTTQPLIIDPVLVYSTYLGGSVFDSARAIAVDSLGNSYVAGITSSGNFPTTAGAVQPTLGGSSDAFVTKLNADGTQILYSTYLGGSNDDAATGIALDASGDVYVAGFTNSTDFPTTSGSYQPRYKGGA